MDSSRERCAKGTRATHLPPMRRSRKFPSISRTAAFFNRRRLILAGLSLVAGGVFASGISSPRLAEAGVSEPAPSGLVPLGSPGTEEIRVELAPYMAGLQTLTHKLSLAVGAGHSELARFYAYESIESLKHIQRDVPEYDGQPVALLIDRYALPRYAEFLEVLRSGDAVEGSRNGGRPEVGALDAAMEKVVESCNDCHAATRHGFIRIVDERERNPFNQSFEPLP